MNLTNWRTTVFGAVTVIAAFITQCPELVGAVVAPDVAKKIAAVAALISGFVTFYHAKDAVVTGNGTVNNPNKVAQSDGTSKVIAPVIVAFLIGGLFLQGCGTVTGRKIADVLVSPANHAIVNFGAQQGGNLLVSSIGGKIPTTMQQPLQTAVASAIGSLSWGVINSVALALRGQQSTDGAASPSALTTAIVQNGPTPHSTAVSIANSVQSLSAQGVPPDVANEAVATALDAAASKLANMGTQKLVTSSL